MDIKMGTYIEAVHPNYRDGVVLDYYQEDDVYLVYADDGRCRKIKCTWLETHIHEGFLRIPEGYYMIWEDERCTCGAKHTSFPNVHLTYCNGRG